MSHTQAKATLGPPASRHECAWRAINSRRAERKDGANRDRGPARTGTGGPDRTGPGTPAGGLAAQPKAAAAASEPVSPGSDGVAWTIGTSSVALTTTDGSIVMIV
jgi:hypothetical protein